MKLSKLLSIILLLFIISFAGPLPAVHGEPSSCVQPSAGMVSWWDGDNNAIDLVSGMDGALVGGATYAAGMVGQAFSFDGADDYVDLPDGFADFTSGFTVVLWANPTSNGSWARFIDLGNGQANNNILFDRRTTSNDLTLEVYDGGGSSTGMASAVDAITNNEWHHYAATLDAAGKVKMYKDGLPLALAADTTGVPTNITRTSNFIGRSNWPYDAYYAGSIDEVQIYNRVLEAAEIAAIYNAGSAGNCKPQCAAPPSGMVSWWGGDNNALDLAGTNNGTAMNGATYAPGEVGQAFSFDGSDDFIDIGAGEEFNFDGGIGDFTIDAWINPSGLRAYPLGIIAKAAYMPVYSGWAFYVSDTGALIFGSPDGLGPLSLSSAAGTISAGIWAHVAVTKAGTTYTMYKNGVAVHSGNYVNLPTSTNPLRAGTVFDDSERFPGLIDEIQIFSRALTAAEIAAIYSAGSSGTCSIDMTPAGFTFDDVADAAPDTEYVSNVISVTGINYSAPISITGGEYAVSDDGGSTWSSFSTTAPATVNKDDQVKVRQTSSGSYSTTTDTVLTIGGVSDTFSVTTRSGADLSITKTDAGYDPINAGGRVTYTMTVTNLGPDAASMVTLTDDLPAGTVADPVPNCSYNTELNQVSCLLVGTLLNGESVDKTITVTVPSTPGVITNTASVTSDTEDPDLANNTASEDTTVRTALTVSIMPDAADGSVTATGINCGQGSTDCTETYSSASDVNLTATPAAGWRFLRWEGSLTGSANPDSVTMDSDRSVTAVFATDRTVCADPLLCSIQTAIDAAGPGDIIKLLRDTTYNENLSISSPKELTISGGWDSGFTTQTADPSMTVISGDIDGDTVGDGRVLAITAGSSVALENLTLANGNGAPGAGICLIPSSGDCSLSLLNVIIRDNSAVEGAAIGAVSNGPALNIIGSNVLIYGNTVSSNGSVEIMSTSGPITVDLINSTITGNMSGDGAPGIGVYSYESSPVTVNITNSIVWNNRLGQTEYDVFIFGSNSTVTAKNSDIGSVSVSSGNYNDTLTNISADPVFVNPAAGDYRLNSDSPAIDAGDNVSASGLSTDIAGQSRVVDGDSDSASVVDMGAFEYQPTAPSAIRLLSLNGGDVIDAGMPFNITWEAPASAERFKVFYSLDNGLTWLKAVSADPAVTGNIVTGQKHFLWDVPVQTKNKKGCKVKVTGYTGAGVKVGTDISDLPFMIRAASLIRPNGPDPLHYGEPYIIRWTTTEQPKAEITTVKLSYTTDGGLTWKAIGSPIAGNPGSYSWTVPTLAKPKAKCRVKVDLYSGASKVGSDTSDYFFTIGP